MSARVTHIEGWESAGEVLARVTRKRRPRGWGRLVLFTLAAVILGLAAFRLYATLTAPWWQGLWANDLIHYGFAVDRWLATGSPYAPHEVAGPFEYGQETFLHPPISLPFFLAWKVIPWPLFWIVPLGLLGYVVWSYRPRPWTWPLMALPLLVYPIGAVIVPGNSDLWSWGLFAAGVRWGWPAALLAIKPSVAIAGVIGIRRRSWWATCLILALLALPFGSLWIEWVRVVLNSPGSLLYSVGNLIMFSIPVVARLGAPSPTPAVASQLRPGPRYGRLRDRWDRGRAWVTSGRAARGS